MNTIYMKLTLRTSTALSPVLGEPEHFYVDIYYLVLLVIVAFTLLLFSFLRHHLYKTKKEKELREIASLVDKNEILIQRYSREMSRIKEQLEAKEKCLKEYQHAAQWKADHDVESLIKEKERLAKCLLEQLDTFKRLKILSKSKTALPASDWVNLIEIVNTLYDDFISRLRVAYPDLTEDAIRFCCLIKLRLTSAELMSVLNVTKDAIYKRKFRLKKELMPDDDPRSLDDFLGSY